LPAVEILRQIWIQHVYRGTEPEMDLRKQLADFERSIELMRDTTPIGQLICMVLRCKSDQKGYLQLTWQSL
jgi:hypothetical protein